MEVLDHKCPGCNAKLPFNPETQRWDCEYCGGSYSLEELTEFEAKQQKAQNEGKTMDADLYECPNCGAQVITDENTSATFCVYCGSTSIIKNRLVSGLRPKYIIPFKKTKKQAIEAFKGFKRGKIFAPKDFSDPANIDKITGVYIPFWLYDSHAKGEVVYNATRVKSWRSGDYRYTQTDTYHAIRDGEIDFARVPVDGSTKFDDDTMDSIEPFKYDDLQDFNMSYLSGFLSEKYDVEEDDAYIRAQNRVTNSTIDQFKTTVKGYTSVTVSSSNLDIEKKTTDYVLLPVWMLNIKYKDKMHLFAMNGQTGKMVGDIPIDNKKRLLYAAGSFILGLIVCTILVFLFAKYLG